MSRQVSAAALQHLLAKAEEVALDPRRFGKYRNDPVGFVRDILGVQLWSKQRDVLLAIVKHRRLAVKSGHGVGKSFVLACAVLWWLYARQGLVVTTASSWHQVEKVLWKEIKGLHKRAIVSLPGTRMMTELRVEEDWWAIGLSTDNPTAFQGQHHTNLLVVVDEAPGIGVDVHEAINSLAVASGNRMVYIGNPTEPTGPFYQAFRPKSGWFTMGISCLDHPNVLSGVEEIPGAVTREWVEERRAEYGEDDPRWQVRVLGDFPTQSNRQVCPPAWVERAMEPSQYQAMCARDAWKSRIMGVDVARFGTAKSVVATRQGDCVVNLTSWQGASIVDSCRKVIELHRVYRPNLIILDDVGVGGGLFDLLVEAGLPVVGFSAGARAARADTYDNLRSECWFGVRDRLEHDRIYLPASDSLLGDLSTPTYSFAANAKIRVERKEQLLNRGVESPDEADAVMMAFSMEMDAGGHAMTSYELRPDEYEHGLDRAILPPGEHEMPSFLSGGIPMHGF